MNGDVRLRVEGLMLERLIMRALAGGARFRSVERDSPRALIFEADPRSAEILAALCARFSLPCAVLSRRGMDAVARRLRGRATLLAGIVTCLACVSLFLSRVWLIDVELTGDRAADVAPIEDALGALGVRPGMSKAALDPSLLEQELAAAATGFSFVGVRLQGVRLLVEASPAVSAPEVYELASARDLVAARDGVVLSVNVRSGTACVRPGDTVVRGQLLIRGEERVTKEETRSIAALGEVVARVWHEGEASAPLTQTVTGRTGRFATSSELRLMDFAWPLVEGADFPQQETEDEYLPIGGLFLPLEIRRTTAWELQSREVDVDEARLRAALTRLAFAEAGVRLARDGLGALPIADQWIEFHTDGGALCARAVYETHTDIAVTRDALYGQEANDIGKYGASHH